MTNYEAAIAYLESIGVFGSQLGLARIEALLDKMGRPEKNYPCIHVTGTNGKGSTSAMLASIAKAAGLKTGLYTSPHLSDYPERIQVNGQAIDQAAFGAAVAAARAAADALVAAGMEQPTQFEILTAAGFWHFAADKVDLAIIEVGLGGLLDSTNVITPVCSVITNVALEHADRCGGTLDGVIEHKGGIIKPGVPVVTAAQEPALEALRAMARAKQAPFYCAGEAWRVDEASVSQQGTRFHYAGFGAAAWYDLQLVGRHQANNAALAVSVMRLVLPQLSVGDARLADAIRHGLAEARWPGRMEAVPHRANWWIDGAHNPHGAAVLRAALDELYPHEPVTFVLGILADKDRGGILSLLVRPADKVIVVPVHSERAASPADIVREIQTESPTVAVDSLAAGLALAAREPGVVCIAGSLYLIGEVRSILWLDKDAAPTV